MIKYDSACFSKGKSNWGTPKALYDQLNKEFGPFKLDPCTTKDNPLGTPVYCTKEQDGLHTAWWLNPVYCNPPYGKEVIEWVKCADHYTKHGVLTVMLLPARTDTKWFHDYIWNKPNVEVRFLRGRQKMIDLDNPDRKPNTAPFPSMVVIFRPI